MRLSTINSTIRPTGNEPGQISNNLVNVPDQDYTLDEVCAKLETGHAVVLERFSGDKRLAENVISSRYIGLDLDETTANFKATATILKDHGFNFYLRYKTYRYTKDHQKHRYILKFDQELTKPQLLGIYRYLSNIEGLNLDKSTTNNLCRLWFGTSHKITRRDSPGEINNFEDFNFDEFEEIELFEGINITYQIKNETYNEKHILEYINNTFDTVDWDYSWYRDNVYSVCALLVHYNISAVPINLFMKSIEPHRLKKWEKYLKHDTQPENVNKLYSKGCLNTLTVLGLHLNRLDDDDDVFNYYSIYQHKHQDPTTGKVTRSRVSVNTLGDSEYISPEQVKDLVNNTTSRGLLVSPSGSGKTTAIIKYAIRNATLEHRVVVTVPTLALCEQLLYEWSKVIKGKDTFNVLYTKKGKLVQPFNSKATLYICTYDQYYRYFTDIKHTLFIDEVHELANFFTISNRKGEVIKKLLQASDNPDIKTIDCTATPFNLADVYDRKSFHNKVSNKKVFLTPTKTPLNETVVIIKENYKGDKKTLVYINSKAKLARVKEILVSEVEGIKIDIISSEVRDKSKSYSELITSNSCSFDVVLVTKVLNIGFDIRGTFQSLIYCSRTLQVNDVLQFQNRERHNAEYHIIVNDPPDSKLKLMLNDTYKIFKSRLTDELSDYDKKIFDNTIIDGKHHPILVTHYYYYLRSTPSNKVFMGLYKLLFNEEIEEVSERVKAEELKIDTVKLYQMFRDNLNNMLNFDNYILWKMTSQLPPDFDDVKNRKCRALLHRFYHKISNGIPDKFFEFIKEIPPKALFNLNNDDIINRLDTEPLRDLLFEIKRCDTITQFEKGHFIYRLNKAKYVTNNSDWNQCNFNRNLVRFGIYMKSQSTKNEEGKSEKLIINQDYHIDILYVELEKKSNKKEAKLCKKQLESQEKQLLREQRKKLKRQDQAWKKSQLKSKAKSRQRK